MARQKPWVKYARRGRSTSIPTPKQGKLAQLRELFFGPPVPISSDEPPDAKP